VSHFTALAVMGRKFMDFIVPASIGTAGPVTYTPAQFLGGLIIRDCAGAARNDTTPSAAEIIAALTVSGRAPVVGNCVEISIRNTSAGAFATTLLAGAGVLLAGTMATAQATTRRFLVTVGDAGVVTVTSLGAQTH
jgi:hypothetical protein